MNELTKLREELVVLDQKSPGALAKIVSCLIVCLQETEWAERQIDNLRSIQQFHDREG